MENKDKENLSRKEKKAAKKAEKVAKPKMNPADKKGIALVAVLTVVALCLIFNFISLLSDSESNESVDISESTSTTQAVTTTQPQGDNVTTTLPDTQQQVSTTKQDDETQNTKPQSTLPQKDEKQEILDVITEGINTLKSSDASFKGHKEQVLDMELTECTVPAFVGIVNGIMDMFIETEIYDFDFTNGKGMDPETKTETTTMDTFPPVGKNFSLTIDGVAEATKEQQGENTVYRVKLKPEKSTKDNPKTQHHENACDTLDLSSFNLPIGEITKADLEYPGATVGITLDKNGKVVGYYERLDTIGKGEARAVGMTGGGTVVGYIDETWTIEWK